VANHPSAEKRNRQREKRTQRNRGIKSAVRTKIKNVREAVASKDPAAAAKALTAASIAIAKAASKGALPKKAASRKVSRLASAVHGLGKA
jgi:small subunit ribosomal protein S20